MPGTPKQGDHVFNDVETAILSPFETIASCPLSRGSGRDFIARYLLHGYHLAKELAGRQILKTARQLTASGGAQEDVLREFAKLRGRYPSLARVNAGTLGNIHAKNSNEFGADRHRYEVALLKEIRHALEAALATPNAKPPAAPQWSGIAFQRMLDAAFDPASALVVITLSMMSESDHIQPAYMPLIVKVAESLDSPGMWKLPYHSFHEAKTATGAIIDQIARGLLGLDSLKSPGVLFTKLIPDEIARGPKILTSQTEAEYGEMLHCLHQHLQRMGGI